jgi:hypothetical protein
MLNHEHDIHTFNYHKKVNICEFTVNRQLYNYINCVVKDIELNVNILFTLANLSEICERNKNVLKLLEEDLLIKEGSRETSALWQNT